MNEPAIKLPRLNLFERFRRWLRQRRRKRLMELESFHAIARHFGREADSPGERAFFQDKEMRLKSEIAQIERRVRQP